MSRQILGIPLVKAILTVGVGWGVATFLWGLGGSFVLGSRDFYSGLVAIVFGYLVVLPITIAAFWHPKVSALCLLTSFLVLESATLVAGGVRYVLIGALVMGLPTAALASGYAYVASLRSKSQASDAVGSH